MKKNQTNHLTSPIVQQPLAQLPADYPQLLDAIKIRIQNAQWKAATAINRERVLVYWEIGNEILTRQKQEGWGAKVVDRLAKDLKKAFPQSTGYSSRNLKYMRSLAAFYVDREFVQQVVAQIPWGHITHLIDHIKDSHERDFYIQQTIENGWSRNVLVHQIESGLYERQGKAVTNFSHTLPSEQSDLAQDMIKDPYHFDFLGFGKDLKERVLEQKLVERVKDFLLELGKGFAYVGNQYHLEVGGQDHYLDLLFYHLRLRCYIVIELKVGDFQPEYAGKMNFYLSAVDDLLRHPDDHPTLGLILCKTYNRIIAEYSLRDTHQPMGIASYKLSEFPSNYQENLPTIDELESSLQDNNF